MTNKDKVRYRKGSLERPDARLFYQCWVPEPLEHVMVVVHGLGEHGGRYGNLVDYFTPKGVGVFAMDHRGHGRSTGIRGHVDAFSQYIEDLAAFVNLVRGDLGRDNVILVGHSLGGLISIAYAQRFPHTLSHLVVSSPALRPKEDPPKVKEIMGKLLARVYPSLTLGNELDPNHVSRDPEVVRAYVSDPLVHDRVSTRFFVEFLRQAEAVGEAAGGMTLPFLLMQAGADGLVDPKASEAFLARVGSTNKQLKVYDGLYHELFNEPEKEQVFRDMEAWLGLAKPGKKPAAKGPAKKTKNKAKAAAGKPRKPPPRKKKAKTS